MRFPVILYKRSIQKEKAMIEVRNLTKRYNLVEKPAADNISFCAMPGEITVLLGPNGAGKSTTIKSIANLLKYQGEITICGYPNKSIEAKQRFGYIPEVPMLYDLLTVDETAEFIGRAYRLKDYKERKEKYMELFELTAHRNKLAKELSKGMRQKLSMMLALLIRPQALLVDEPMVGLDPASIETVLKLFVEMKKEGISILISTHIIDIVNEIWDCAYIMDQGKIVRQVRRGEEGDESLKEIFFETTKGEKKEEKI